MKFYQARSNAIILYDTLPSCCISKVVVTESGEIIYEGVYVSPRPPPKISFKDNWMCDLDSDIARSSNDIPTMRTNTPNPIIKYRETCYKNGEKKPWNVPRLIATLLIIRSMIMSQIQRTRIRTRLHKTFVRGNPSQWIKKKSTKLISENQDCHTQLLWKQNISEFKSL